MTYGDLLKYQSLVDELDSASLDDGSKAVDAILLIDSYRKMLKVYQEAKQKWGKENSEFAEKWDDFVNKNKDEILSGETVEIPVDLREGKRKLDKFNEELFVKEAEGFEPRVIFNSLDEWKSAFKNIVPREIRAAKELGILNIE
jgi:hypothetical protein